MLFFLIFGQVKFLVQVSCQCHQWFWSYNFFCKKLTRNPKIGSTLVWVLPNIWRLGRVKDTKFDSNVSNEMLLNAAKCQVYSFYRFWDIKGKPTGRGRGEVNYPRRIGKGKVFSSDGKLMTSLYSKSTDCHQYLHYKSSPPEHTKRSIIDRLQRVCSQESDFKEHSSKLKPWFLKRSYRIIDTGMKKILDGKNRKVNNKTEKGMPFVVTFRFRYKIFKR